MLSEQPGKVALLEAIAQSWNLAGINYAVAHGLEGYPMQTGRDLDVIVQSDHITLALKLAEAVFRERGWKVAHPPGIWGKRLIAVPADGTTGMLEVHTLAALTWRNALLVDCPEPRNWIGPFKIDPWVSFAKRVLGPVLGGNDRRFITRPGEFAASEEELRAAEDRLPRVLGAELARDFIGCVRNADVQGVLRLSSRLRRSAMTRSGLLRPLQSLRLGSKSLRRKVLQPLSPTAPVIAIVGPDGVGKSTTLRALEQTRDHVFLDIIVRHWRPGVLPRLAQLVGREMAQPGADGLLPPRRRPGRFQTVRLLYYYLDFLIGGLIRDRIDSSRQRLVLYDRCFLDMAVDPVRFGLASSRGTDVCWRWLPKPDRVIMLSDDAARIHARKPELTAAEIQTHLDEWHRFVTIGRVHKVIAVNASPDQVAAQIWDVIVEAFLEKNGWDPQKGEVDNTK